MQLIDLVKNAKDSTYKLQSLSTDIKNKALLEIAEKLEQNKNIIFEANKKDLEYAKKLLDENKISLSMFNRLKLDENKMIDIISFEIRRKQNDRYYFWYQRCCEIGRPY